MYFHSGLYALYDDTIYISYAHDMLGCNVIAALYKEGISGKPPQGVAIYVPMDTPNYRMLTENP